MRIRQDGGLYEYEVEAEVSGERARRARISNATVEETLDGVSQEIDADRARGVRDWVMQRVYFTFLPYRLNDPDVWKTDLGLEEWEERDLHKVKVSFTPGSSEDSQDEYLFWFDPANGRLELFAYSYERNGGGLRFRKLFNYRRVGGILFFDQENWGAEGGDLAVDDLSQEFVQSRMRHVSTVTLSDIRVEPLR